MLRSRRFALHRSETAVVRSSIPARPPCGWLVAALAVLPGSGSLAADPLPLPRPADIPAVDAVVDVREFGEFRIAFYRQDAPNHVAHFLTLVASGFYDGFPFHRVIPELLIQTGDPRHREGGDPARTRDSGGIRLPPEPSERPVRRGSVVMAWRGSEPGTAGTQWFVSLGDFPEMREGTVIGEVVTGMEVVDRISQVSTWPDRVPYHLVAIESVRLVGSEPGR